MRFYRVSVKRGHCGSGYFLPMTFGIAAHNIIDAMDHARRMPGVKHHKFILSASEITFSEYCVLRKQSAYERSCPHDYVRS